MKSLVVFQGGGALGAFGAGAWHALVASPVFARTELIAVAGASIGALNAAMVAHHHADPDRGSAALLSLWRGEIATPTWPFFGLSRAVLPPTGAGFDDWSAFATGVLLGNGLSRARWARWLPIAGLQRFALPLHDRSPMWSMLERHFPPLTTGPDVPDSGPMLAVASVDVVDGTLRLFDSDTAPLGPQQVAASSAIPLLYDPVMIDDRLYWDGEITRDSMLPALLARLLESGRLGRNEPLQVFTIEQFPRGFPMAPRAGAEVAYRAISLLQADKLAPVAVDGVRVQHWTRVIREPLAEDGVSGQFDYSPERIERLIAQGEPALARASQQGTLAAVARRPSPSTQHSILTP